jgi:hypothetical protein
MGGTATPRGTRYTLTQQTPTPRCACDAVSVTQLVAPSYAIVATATVAPRQHSTLCFSHLPILAETSRSDPYLHPMGRRPVTSNHQ